MNVLLALVIGALYGTGLFLILRRSITKVLFGLILWGHGSNLLIFVSCGLTRGNPPLIPEGKETLQPPYADPVAQALVLTAIVISFAVVSFTAVLLYRIYRTIGTDDIDQLRASDS